MRVFFSLLLFFSCIKPAFSQQKWHFSNPEKSKIKGAAIEDAYPLLPKTNKKVVVAVIDSGTDIDHTAIKKYIWNNVGEIPTNHKDDDGNGYVDDVHGWNYIGSKSEIEFEAEEETREYQQLKRQYANVDTTGKDSLFIASYKQYLKKKKTYEKEQMFRRFAAKGTVTMFRMYRDHMLVRLVGVLTTGKTLKKDLELAARVSEMQVEFNKMNSDSMRHAVVGDNPDNLAERYYGNGNVIGPDPMHGTHVAGIIAGIAKGTADRGKWLQLMILRVVPNGDERDKDIANAIRYAVDNGASVINMSFGKSLSMHKSVVDDAVKYAQTKDVLLIHSAGNEAKYIDSLYTANFPNPFVDSAYASNWIEVGASGKRMKKLAASFSNYGVQSADLFAPGVKIYSTMPNDEYDYESGTSMAAPVVSGIAALLRSHYPKLSAPQVKEVLMKSVTKYNHYTDMPGNNKMLMLFNIMSKSGGVVNAAAAVKLANTL